MLGLSIKHLLGAPVGTAGEDTIQLAAVRELFDVEDEVALTGPLGCQVRLLRVEGGFEVYLLDLAAELSLTCHTCLRPYTFPLQVPKTMPVFFGLPGTEEEQDFAVDVAKARLPIDVWLREEVLMALPIMQKCDRADCVIPALPSGDDRPERDTHNPFAGLKDLLEE